ncbi:phage holin [Bacillus thuringiensis]|uniref:phage holin n=1 Tax=Bacillus thuringiensis TaxID=1428 RepID=UPI000AAB034D|nr:phage holin [Bacillus thuringiensis]
MLQKENLSDSMRLLAGFLLSLKLLFTSFGIHFITNDQIDAIVNVVSFLFILYFGYKNNYVGKKGTFCIGSFLSLTHNNFICLQWTI